MPTKWCHCARYSPFDIPNTKNRQEGIINARLIYSLLVLICIFGCARSRSHISQSMAAQSPTLASIPKATSVQLTSPVVHHEQEVHSAESADEFDSEIILAAMSLTSTGSKGSEADEPTQSKDKLLSDAEQLLDIPPSPDANSGDGELSLEEVIQSVYQYFPSLEAAIFSRGIAAGEYLSAEGAFDTKLKAASENGPTGFYRTFRQSVGVIQPIYQGGEFFAGYRIGRGEFEPWYKERETNEGGEFKAGVVLPLARDQQIDERRAELWKANYDRFIVEPEIQAQLIDFVQEATLVYWEWVAAGESYRVAEDILALAKDRTDRIRSQVKNGLLPPLELSDNLRLVSERQGKLAESQQKLQKAAIKLSLYYRDKAGQPVIPLREQLPEFGDPQPVDEDQLNADAQLALQQRPELTLYSLFLEQLNIDYAQACNNLRPEIDAVFTTSQDMGIPTSSKNDKGEFELDASIFVNVPIQRRKARGKIQAVESKMSQLNAKRRMTEDKIVTEVQTAHAAMLNAAKQYEEVRQAIEYAEELAQRERVNFEQGTSDLLKVTLREQYAVEARLKAIDALLSFYAAKANYRAALAQDRLE